MTTGEIASEQSGSKKHAYLIMAHNEFGLLKKLVQLLDDERNDIYVHVDKKSNSFNLSEFESITNKSKLVFIPRMKVAWEGFSTVKCEIALLKAAAKNGYMYYHLLSGADLPLKKQAEIHAFFDQHAGKEFISFHHEALSTKNFFARIRYYHFFQEFLSRGKKGALYQLNRALIKGQQVLHVDRIRKTESLYKKGSQWFSITDALAKLVISEEETIHKLYRFTLCPDEIFLPTIAWNSRLKDNLCDDYLRLIDWKRGRPYVFRYEDQELLLSSGAFWARKFSEGIDQAIIEKIYQSLRNFEN